MLGEMWHRFVCALLSAAVVAPGCSASSLYVPIWLRFIKHPTRATAGRSGRRSAARPTPSHGAPHPPATKREAEDDSELSLQRALVAPHPPATKREAGSDSERRFETCSRCLASSCKPGERKLAKAVKGAASYRLVEWRLASLWHSMPCTHCRIQDGSAPPPDSAAAATLSCVLHSMQAAPQLPSHS